MSKYDLEDNSMFCQKCGANIQNDAKYCPYCCSPIEYTQQNQNNQSQAQYQRPDYQNYQNGNNGYSNDPYHPPVVLGKGDGIASLILGICALVTCGVPFLGFILGMLGLVFGKASLDYAKLVGQSNGLAIAGIVCSSIVVGIYIIWFAFLIMAVVLT